MLRTRVFSALVMAPLVVCAVLFLDNPVFSLVLGIILLAGAWEWSHLVPVAATGTRLLYCAAVAVLLWLLWQAGVAEQKLSELASGGDLKALIEENDEAAYLDGKIKSARSAVSFMKASTTILNSVRSKAWAVVRESGA